MARVGPDGNLYVDRDDVVGPTRGDDFIFRVGPGSKVKFAYPHSGFDHDQRAAMERLVVDQIYTLIDKKISNWHTDFYLVEVPGAWNSVLFEEVKDAEVL